ncbi:50S ribosomal protein L19e [Candidatus Woesearchaeota archaeon]|nr:50S ribosomal protein L19e [Candidatus Woesearchaeota archaeon]
MKLQKRLAASIMKCSAKRIVFDTGKIKEIKEAITKADVKKLIQKKIITVTQKQGISRARSIKIQRQKQKGRRKGHGSRKGKINARTNNKRSWINTIRAQRNFLLNIKQKQLVSSLTYRALYKKAHGGFFRSVNHIKLYLTENKLWKT